VLSPRRAVERRLSIVLPITEKSGFDATYR
jgi:hypothetical protein